jgi:hypothetical protein
MGWTKFRSLFRTRNGPVRLSLVLLAPIIILAVDFYRYPMLFSKYTPQGAGNINEVLRNGSVPLGNFRGHQVFASIGEISDPQFLYFIRSGTTGLVVSAYVETVKGQSTVQGALQGAVMGRVQSVSKAKAVTLADHFSNLTAPSSWDVSDFPLDLSDAEHQVFPINRVLVVALPIGRADAAELKKALVRTMIASQDAHIANLVVPPLTVRIAEHAKESLSFSDFFQTFFSAIPIADYPDRLYLSLDQSWPTSELQSAMESLNEAWRQIVTDEQGDYILYRHDLRLIMAALIVCLIVCSFSVKYTLKNFLIISLAFIGLSLGADKWVTPLVVGSNANALLEVQAVVLLIMALAFPLIVTWNPKNVFDRNGV